MEKRPLITFQECIETLEGLYLIPGVEYELVCINIKSPIIKKN